MQNGAMPPLELIQQYCQVNGTEKYEACIALDSPLVKRPDMWPEPLDEANLNPDYYAEIDLCKYGSGHLLTELSKSISASVQFPRSTVFMHGLGVIAAALSKSFYVEQYGAKKPITIYTVTAQPPSTGKSGVNNKFCHPIRDIYEEINHENLKERAKINRKIRQLERDLGIAEKKNEEHRIEGLEDDIFELQEQLKNYPEWRFAIDDATPEAMETLAGSQKGMVNIISAESDAVNIMLGGVYGDKKANFGMVLKAWDGERHESVRVTRDAYSGYVRMCIAVIAQDESIDAILKAGMSGRGVSERVFLLREKTLLGHRDHEVYNPVDGNLYLDYKNTIRNILHQNERVVLTLCSESQKVMREYRAGLEPDLGDSGKYSNTMLRGFIGKCEKHITHIAAVLHCVNEWSNKGNRGTVIQIDTLTQAMNVFNDLVRFYVKAADSLGYAGVNSEIECVKNYLARCAERGKLKVTIQNVRDSVKGNKAFSGVTQINMRLKDVIIPALESGHFCYQFKSSIYINPRLK